MWKAPELRLSRNPNEPHLRYQFHRPAEKAVGSVFLTHGYAEHSGRYAHVIRALTERNLLVLSYDLRGHGFSGGPRGHIEYFSQYLADAHDLLRTAEQDSDWKQCGKPILLGHSLGGLISSHLAIQNTSKFKALVLSSPFLGMALHVPLPKQIAGRWMSKLWPTFSLPTGLSGADLTHDAVMAEAYDNDPLLVKEATSRMFTESSHAQEQLMEKAHLLTIPLVIFHGAEDKVAAPQASSTFASKVHSETHEVNLLPGQYHEIFNEVLRDQWIKQAADRIVSLAAA
jgi:lysophospholipase